MKRYFISGIGTGVGKTVMSALLCEALQADYWKPVQAGDLENSDTLTAQGLISNSKPIFTKKPIDFRSHFRHMLRPKMRGWK